LQLQLPNEWLAVLLMLFLLLMLLLLLGGATINSVRWPTGQALQCTAMMLELCWHCTAPKGSSTETLVPCAAELPSE
jgi:hypothetical protein